MGDRCVPAIPSGRQTYKRGYIQCSLDIGPVGQRPQPARPLTVATRIPPSQAINSSDVPEGVVKRRALPPPWECIYKCTASPITRAHPSPSTNIVQAGRPGLSGRNQVFPRGDRPGPAGWGSVCKDHQFPITLLFAL